MIKATIAQYRGLRSSVKAMLYLHWVYTFVGSMTEVFVNIYLYKHFESVLFNIIANMVYFVGCGIGFSLIGYVAAFYRMNMKRGYLSAFGAMCLSFFFLYGAVSVTDALVFMFVNGFGLGLYWVTLHTFELTETENHERDYYSSILSAGDQIITLTAPAFATLLFYLSDDVLHVGTYTLLFISAPLLYLLGIPLFGKIGSYHPHPIERIDVIHFLTNKKNIRAQLYLFATSADYAVASVIIPVSTIIFLGTEKHVGMFATIFAVISAAALIGFSRVRHSGNRLRFLFVTVSISALATFLIAARFELAIFIAYSLVSVLVRPLRRVSEHVIDLETMEMLGREESDFFPTMIFRDAAFAVWRLLTLSLFALLVLAIGEGVTALRIGFAVIGMSLLLIYIGARLFYRSSSSHAPPFTAK